jgi:alkylation response protein AidB-like acyl-CoA dehydrogenase
MDLDGPIDDEPAFRAEVRDFLSRNFTPELRAAMQRQTGAFAEGELARAWHEILYQRGWIAPSWPKEYGGTGWTGRQRSIFQEECARLGTPLLPGMGLNLCGPVIMKFGSPEQKAYFLPRILSGEHYWCQGYSEPQAGSDLASLQTRAARDGDDYVVNGSKIWTTHAHHANWIFLLVRTASTGRRQEGISFIVAPLDTPGITVRPILLISGEHEVNEVFLDAVRIPAANRIGPENDGWTVAKYLLEFERSAAASAVGLLLALKVVVAIARREGGDDGRPLLQDAEFRRKITELEIEVKALGATERRLNSGHAVGESIGAAAASIEKLAATELGQRIEELALEALGAYALPDQRRALDEGAQELAIGPEHAFRPTARYLNGRATTIAGGSSEIQRNIIARVALGL